jgi:ribonuclease Z
MRWILTVFGGLAAVAAAGFVALRTPPIEDRLFEGALARSFGQSDRFLALEPDDGLAVIFAGTGSPLPSAKRAQNATAVLAGGRIFIVDAGTGSFESLQRAGAPGDRVAAVFLTHFHSDHIGDLGEIDLGSWVSGRPATLSVYGPKGVESVVAGVNLAHSQDREYRTAHHGKGVAEPRTKGLVAQAFAEPGVIYEKDGLIVTAFSVAHEPVSAAVGYRFDYKGRSVVISGDTAYSPSLVAAAKGADLLAHEAQANAMVAKMGSAASAAGVARLAKIMSDIPSYHTSPADAARVAGEAGVNALVLTHLTPAPDNALARRIFLRDLPTEWRAKTRLAEDGLAAIVTGGGVTYQSLY